MAMVMRNPSIRRLFFCAINFFYFSLWKIVNTYIRWFVLIRQTQKQKPGKESKPPTQYLSWNNPLLIILSEKNIDEEIYRKIRARGKSMVATITKTCNATQIKPFFHVSVNSFPQRLKTNT